MIIDKKRFEEYILPQVERPSQYVGGELNSISKDWEAAPVRMAFAFPDSYEIGMSHLGMRLLYEAINNHSRHLCERVFMPLLDMAQLLREYKLPLFTLESFHELRDFDVVGFTLQYELSFSNILAMLDLAHIPLRADQRGEGDPLIVAGGPCAYNPEPLADIIDLFFIGEGEEMDIELLDLIAEGKRQGWSRTELLRRAVGISGVYVPRFYQAEYREDGQFRALSLTADAPENTPLTITKRIITDFEHSIFPEAPIVPHVKPVHDRIMLEVMRGCARGCRFCQAGVIYRPVREKSVEKLREQAAAQEQNSGYDDMALLSLSTADYSGVEGLMTCLLNDHSERGVGISLPSLRVDAFSVGLASRTQEVRKSGITLAPEAGSQRMRDVINKGVSEEDIYTAAATAFSQGYTHIKLYFIIGLPYETDSDITAIADLCRQILRIGKENKPAEIKKPVRISLGVAYFVPKCNTPFQWRAQDSAAELRRKNDLLREAIRPLRQVTLNRHDWRSSLLEAAFARGDRRLGQVILTAYQRGCCFDGWTEHFKFDTWCEAFSACGLSAESFAERELAYGEALPWAHISCGVKEEWLWQENLQAARAELTPDCRWNKCSNCGVCRKDGHKTGSAEWKNCLQNSQLKPEPRPHAARKLPVEQGGEAATYKYRLCLGVEEPVCWLSHLDLLGALEKALRRSALPVAYSQGFNPHMLISWGPAHPVGLRGQSEYVDLSFTEELDSTWTGQLRQCLPPGLTLIKARRIEQNEAALMSAVDYAVYRALPQGDFTTEQLECAIGRFMQAEQVELERVSPKGSKRVNIRPAVEKLYCDGDYLVCELWLNRGAAVKMPELIPLLLPGAHAVQTERTAMYVSRSGQHCEP